MVHFISAVYRIGEGFTLIWRPNFGGAKDFFLQLMHTVEALEVSGFSGTIVNRGNIQPDLFLGAISYVQSVRDRFDGSGQHFEPGIWLNVLQTKNLKEPASVVRMGSVPRGSAFQLQGQARTLANMANLIKPASIKPFKGSTAIDS